MSQSELDRVVAVDWSGDKGPGQRKKIWSAVWTRGGRGRVDGGTVTLSSGRTREQWTAWMLELAAETPRMVVGLDCCFSYPAWFLREQGCASVFDLWHLVANDAGERWLCDASEGRDVRFWGKPHKRPEIFSGDGRARMMRRTDWENKIEQAMEGGDTVRAALMAGITPKSPFQIGGSGSVGTGSLRAMEWLERLHAGGFRVWPFEASGLKENSPLLVEMYTRLLTGPVKKSNPASRKAYLARRRAEDPLYAGLPRLALAGALGSEDGFDALVCCLEMVRNRAEFAHLQPTRDPGLQLEGITWRPGVSEHG